MLIIVIARIFCQAVRKIYEREIFKNRNKKKDKKHEKFRDKGY
jgi:hypothetical protein